MGGREMREERKGKRREREGEGRERQRERECRKVGREGVEAGGGGGGASSDLSAAPRGGRRGVGRTGLGGRNDAVAVASGGRR